MLLRIVIKPHKDTGSHSWETKVVCTNCGQENTGSTFKAENLTSMSRVICTYCGKNLDNQEQLNKKVEARLTYHKSK